jgi:hypothetical protein
MFDAIGKYITSAKDQLLFKEKRKPSLKGAVFVFYFRKFIQLIK